MKTLLASSLFIAAMMQSVTVVGSDHPELEVYSAAKDGMQRFVSVLDHKKRDEEDAFKLEIIIGKLILTDGVNRYRLGSVIETHTLQGWGYAYFDVTDNAPVISTRMAVPGGTPPVRKFVTGSPLLVSYNSRFPVVVYVPTGYEVRYRIWQANEFIRKPVKR